MTADAIRHDPSAAVAYDLAQVRADFPILAQEIYGNPLSFLDSAASAQKPRQVIDAVSGCYETQYANIHRGVYYLSERTTEAFEGARETVRHYLNAAESREVVFVRGGHRGHQSGGVHIRSGQPLGRRRGRAVAHGAPLQHRALADAA